MKPSVRNSLGAAWIGLALCLTAADFSADAMEPQTLFNFQDGLSGAHPRGGLIIGPDGNFYGTTQDGGTNNAGTIFRLTADGVFTSLFSFNTTNGASPQAGLVLGKDGNLYGTTAFGGDRGSGTVFRFGTNGTLTRLGSLGGTNGAHPQCQLVMDADGNFYGTAPDGPNSFGTVFRLATNGVLSTLVPFNLNDGSSPQCDGLALGNDGNLYGDVCRLPNVLQRNDLQGYSQRCLDVIVLL